MAEEIHVSISQESVKQIIDAKVQAAVMDALKPNADAFIEQLVVAALTCKSTNDKYRYNNQKDTPSVLQHMVMEMLQEETKKAIKAFIEENREKFASSFSKSLKNDSKIIARISDSMIGALLASSQYNFKVEITPKVRD